MAFAETSRPDRSSNQGRIQDRSSGRFRRALRFVQEKGAGEVLRLAREHGFRGSLNFVARNLRHVVATRKAHAYDARFNVDTAGSIQLDTLTIVGPNVKLGNECVCTSPKSFDWIMRYLPRDLSRFTFIDIGAGKSRTLLLASNYNFKRVTGVEFARELVEISRRNFRTFRNPAQKCRVLDIIEADASAYDYPQGPLVVYFYNPFKQPLFEKVLARLVADLKSSPRECYVVYASSIHNAIGWAAPLIAQAGPFEEIPTQQMPLFLDAVRGLSYAVFKTR